MTDLNNYNKFDNLECLDSEDDHDISNQFKKTNIQSFLVEQLPTNSCEVPRIGGHEVCGEVT